MSPELANLFKRLLLLCNSEDHRPQAPAGFPPLGWWMPARASRCPRAVEQETNGIQVAVGVQDAGEVVEARTDSESGSSRRRRK
jgi:hypothetical protein